MKTTFGIRGLVLPALLALNFATPALSYAGRDYVKPTANTHQALPATATVTPTVQWTKCSLDNLDQVFQKKAQQVIAEILSGEDRSKPETLRGDYQGLMSRRINKKDRLVYSYDQASKKLEIHECGGHYKFS